MSIKLLDYEESYLQRGDYLFISDLNLELMLMDGLSESDGLWLVQTAGGKAGLVYLILPKDSCLSDSEFVLSRKWFIENYTVWFGQDTSIENVYVKNNQS